MSNHHHHTPTPHVTGPRTEPLKPQSIADTGESQRAGRMVRWASTWVVKILVGVTAFSGGNVLDLLRMESASMEFLSWRRLFLIWASLVGYLGWACGAPGAFIAYFLFSIGGLIGGFNLALIALHMCSFPWINGLLSTFCSPASAVRFVLIKKSFGDYLALENLQELRTPRLGDLSLMDLQIYVDWASMLIPVGLTLLATVKFFQLRKNAGECVGVAWTPTQKALLTIGVIVLLFGLPGAPAGFWVVASLLWWAWFGVTKSVQDSTSSREPIGMDATFEIPPPSGADLDKSNFDTPR